MSKTDCYTCKKLVDDDVCKIGGVPSFLKEDCPYYEPKHKKPTNFDCIKAMSIEEMAMWMAGFDGSGMCNYCDRDSTWPMIADYGCELGDGAEVCADGIKRWLQQEADLEKH